MLARSKCKRRAPTAVLGITALLAAVSTAPMAASAAPAPVQVSIFASPSTGVVNLNTNWFTKYVEKKFNMNINWVLAPSSDTSTKAALLLASGKYPDAFFDPSIPLASILKYGQEGVVVPLDNLINQYAPNVAAGMKANPTAREAAGPPKGPIYDVAYFNYCWHCNWHTKGWINTQLLKKYDLSVPTTTTQLTHVLEVFKSHGVTAPLTGAGPISSSTCWGCDVVTWLMNSFIYDPGSENASGYFEIGPGGKLLFSPAQPQWRAGLTYIHGLYQDGLINSSALIQTNTQLETQLSQPGSTGAFMAGGPNGEVPTNEESGQWLSIPPLKGPSGTRYAAFYGNGSQATPGMLVTNHANSAQKEALMKLANFLWTPLGTEMMDFGPQGKYWTPAKPGQKGLNGEQAIYNTNFDEFYSTNVYQNDGWNQMGPMDQSAAWRNGSLVAVSPLTPAGAQELLQFATQAFYAGFEPSQVVPSSIWVPPADSQTFATLETNIGDYVEQWADQFVDGAKSLSTDWNSYVHGLNGLRLAQYTALTKQSMGTPLSTASYVSDAAGVKYLKSLVSSSDATALQLFNAAYTQVRG
jgi:putative aldouronate transport system substrate-binding protein